MGLSRLTEKDGWVWPEKGASNGVKLHSQKRWLGVIRIEDQNRGASNGVQVT